MAKPLDRFLVAGGMTWPRDWNVPLTRMDIERFHISAKAIIRADAEFRDDRAASDIVPP
jgi:hypothetical protein